MSILSPATPTRLTLLFKLLIGPLFALTIAYNLAGFGRLVRDTPGSYPIDLRLRWIEEKLVAQGSNPQLHGHPDAKVGESHAVMLDAGGSYPPWSYATGMLLVPPFTWNSIRWYFAFINALALWVVCRWAARSVQGSIRFSAATASLAVASVFPIAICVSYGQYGLLITAFLAAAFTFAERGDDELSGLCLGVAMVKPQLAAPFVLAMFLRGKYRPPVWAVAYVLLASGVTGYLVGANPVTMLRNMSREAAIYTDLSHNPFILMLQRKIGFEPATLSAAALGLLITTLIVFPLRKKTSMLAAFSVCALVCMFWSYRKHYDVVLMAFPLVFSIAVTCRQRSWVAIAVFLSIGVSLWLPIRDAQWHWPIVAYGQAAIWVIGVGVLLALESNEVPKEATTAQFPA